MSDKKLKEEQKTQKEGTDHQVIVIKKTEPKQMKLNAYSNKIYIKKETSDCVKVTFPTKYAGVLIE